MYEVKDGARTLQFDGLVLGKSSSWRKGSYRWIEFELYRTESGSYVLSRIGVSLIYHGPESYRYWAQVSEDPKAVLEALYKYDVGGARYLTNVAQRLLEVAAKQDSGIDSIYRVEIIP